MKLWRSMSESFAAYGLAAISLSLDSGMGREETLRRETDG